jgi:hypothetical protein
MYLRRAAATLISAMVLLDAPIAEAAGSVFTTLDASATVPAACSIPPDCTSGTVARDRLDQAGRPGAEAADGGPVRRMTDGTSRYLSHTQVVPAGSGAALALATRGL